MPVSVGIQNLTGADLAIADLGLIIGASSTMDLTGSKSPGGIRTSSDLVTAVTNDQALVVDDGVPLSKALSLLFLEGAALTPEAISTGPVSGTNISVSGAVTAQTGSFSLGLTLSGLPVSVVEDIGDNLIINGGFRISQRLGSGGVANSTTTPANNDDTFIIDRWILLSDGNDIVDSVLSNTAADEEAGIQSALALVVQTTNKKFGIFQPIERVMGYTAYGNPVSLQVRLTNRQLSSTVTHVRAAIVGWTGTADSITSDIVSSWNAEGTNPTMVASWQMLNTPVDLSVSNVDGVATLNKIENVLVPLNTYNNIGVFIWSDDTATTVGHQIAITGVKLEVGSRCTAYRERNFTQEVAMSQRYYCKTFPLATATGDNVTALGCLQVWSSSTSSTGVRAMWRFPVEMRTTPTITTYNTGAGTAGAWNRSGTAIAAQASNTGSSGVTITNNAVTTAGALHIIQAAAEAEL
jgi:hypothetical protein